MSSDSLPFQNILQDIGLTTSAAPKLTPLTGGVSCEIYLVEDGDRRFVVKRALAKLKVAADWTADISRNQTEQACLRYIAGFRPDAVPSIHFSSEEHGLFAMDYLDGFANWKSDLLAGVHDSTLARKAGALLGQIHARSWNEPGAHSQFDTTANFDQLRLDPYLRTIAAKHPELSEAILVETVRLAQTRQCLVHGDFSPKNLLHKDGRLVLLDCEVAWFGDPCFDLAFFLNHFFLKSLYHTPHILPYSDMIAAARGSYLRANPDHAAEIAARSARLLPMLLLARVDGKSPVEYLTHPDKKEFVRSFATEHIRQPLTNLGTLTSAWFQKLKDFPS